MRKPLAKVPLGRTRTENDNSKKGLIKYFVKMVDGCNYIKIILTFSMMGTR
jgi:hypothetical protein